MTTLQARDTNASLAGDGPSNSTASTAFSAYICASSLHFFNPWLARTSFKAASMSPGDSNLRSIKVAKNGYSSTAKRVGAVARPDCVCMYAMVEILAHGYYVCTYSMYVCMYVCTVCMYVLYVCTVCMYV